MIVTADNGTGETLAILLRPGNKGANSAKDHIDALSQALAVLPDDFYDTVGALIREKLLVRTDSAGAPVNSSTTLSRWASSSPLPIRYR